MSNHPKIRGLRRLDETSRRIPIVGDNWHTTWTTDGRQLTGMCDGNGNPMIEGHTGLNYNSVVLEMTEGPEAPQFHHLPNFPVILSEHDTWRKSRYYGFGILAVDGHIYHYMSTPNYPFLDAGPSPRFVGAKLIHSPDGGATWRNWKGGPVTWEEWQTRDRDNMVFFEEGDGAFSLLTALQMGCDYELNRDGYAYFYAPNGNSEGTMNQLVMFRVPRDRILDRAAHEYFVATKSDGTAEWTSVLEKRGVVHTFPSGWVNTSIHPYAWHPSVVYHPGFDCYLMANWGMGCGPDGEWFGKPSYLGFWVGEHPWGPWTQIHEDTAWMPAGDAGARAYQPQIIPAWISADNKSFWLTWTDFQLLDGGRPYYCYNYQQVEIQID